MEKIVITIFIFLCIAVFGLGLGLGFKRKEISLCRSCLEGYSKESKWDRIDSKSYNPLINTSDCYVSWDLNQAVCIEGSVCSDVCSSLKQGFCEGVLIPANLTREQMCTSELEINDIVLQEEVPPPIRTMPPVVSGTECMLNNCTTNGSLVELDNLSRTELDACSCDIGAPCPDSLQCNI